MADARKRSSALVAIAEINITPLVDDLLTVLIILMATTTLVTKSIPFSLTSAPGAEKQELRILGLSIRDTGERVFDGHFSSRYALDQSLRVAAARGVPVSLKMRPDAHSSYDNLANVLAIVHNNEITSLRVLSPPTEPR